MLYSQLDTNTEKSHLNVKTVLGVQNGRIYQNTWNLLREFTPEKATPRAILERLGLLEVYKVRAAGSLTKVAKNEAMAVMQSPAMGKLIKNYLKAPKNPKNTCKATFVMKGDKVWCMLSSPAFSKTAASLDTPRGNEIPDFFIEITDGQTEEEQTQVLFVDEVKPKNQNPDKKPKKAAKKAVKPVLELEVINK